MKTVKEVFDFLEDSKTLGADRKEEDKAFADLKKEGAIVSPVRCKWEPVK